MRKTRSSPLEFDQALPLKQRHCEQDGCESLGEFRAPKSPYHLRDYYWFCLKHVREYNKAWDFYRGMSPQEIEASRNSDVTWNRPSWPIGGWHTILENIQYFDRIDPISKAASPLPSLPQEVQKSLGTLDLTFPLTMETLKAQYKKLAKRHHPDLNSGDKNAEERLKAVNEAYRVVRKHLE